MPDQDVARRPTRSSAAQRNRSRAVLLAGSTVAAVIASQAPATLTGDPHVDTVERAGLAFLTTYVGAHGHRRTWLVAGIVAALAARGLSLALVLIALVIALIDSRGGRRSRRLGAGVAGALTLAVLWFPSDGSPVLVHAVGIAVVAMLWWSGAAELRSRSRRVIGTGVVVAGLGVLVAIALAGYAALAARGEVEAGTRSAKQALAAIEQGDASGADQALARAQKHLSKARRTLGAPIVPGRLVPGMAQQIDAVDVAVDQGLAVADAAREIVSIDYDSLRYNGRIDLDKVRSLQPGSTRVQRVLASADRTLGRTAAGPLLPQLRDRITELREEVERAHRSATVAAEVLQELPTMLGGNGAHRYLVVFLTPAELRGAGGFIGNYAELVATDGDVDLVRSGRINDLIEAVPPGIRTIDGPEDYVRRYARFTPEDYLQDVPYSPDWALDADVLAQLYPQSGGAPVNGVIAVDPAGLAALLKLTGPVALDGVEAQLSADNAVEFLTREQYLNYGDRAARAEILDEATRQTFTRLTESSLPAPRSLADALGPAARGRHLQAWSPDPGEQSLFELLGADGGIEVPAGEDGLALAQINHGNNKIDAYLSRTVTYQPTLDAETGDLTAVLTIALTNNLPAAPESLPDAVVGNTRGAPRGTSMSIYTVLTPHDVTSATVDGQPIEIYPDREAGLKTWETPVVSIPPDGTTIIRLELRGRLDLGPGYRFRYLRPPVANPDLFYLVPTVENGFLVIDGRDATTATIEDNSDETVEASLSMHR